MKNLVSIIMPVYNSDFFLEEALNSALNQTYRNIEIICIDDCSTDNSINIIKKYMLNDSRIKLIQLEVNSKTSIARNIGIKHAKGKYILPFDSDDIISDTFIEKCLKIHLENDVDVVYTNYSTFGEIVSRNQYNNYNPEKFVAHNIICCTAMYKKESWEKYGGYDEAMIYGSEDWDFWLYFVEDKATFYRINEELFHYRARRYSRTSLQKTKKKILKKQIKKNHPELFRIRVLFKNSYYRRYIIKEIRRWLITIKTRKGEKELRILGFYLYKQD